MKLRTGTGQAISKNLYLGSFRLDGDGNEDDVSYGDDNVYDGG